MMLQTILAPTVARVVLRRRLLAGALVFALGAAAAWALGLAADFWAWDSRLPWLALASGVVAAAYTMDRWVKRIGLDPTAIARQIERAHPDLQALLLTAVAEDRRPQGGYVQQQLLLHAVERAAPAIWARSVAPWELNVTGGACALAGLLFLALTVPGLLPGLPSLLPDEYGVSVNPGHTEVERGHAVIVMARFAKRLPSHVTLVVRIPGEGPHRIEMTRNLADPVFAGQTPPILGDRADYTIEYAGHRTARFRIAAFELPDLRSFDARVSYTGRPAREIKDVRTLSVVQGAEVALTAHLNKSVRKAELVDEQGKATALGGRGADRVVVLRPTQSARYELRLEDEQGRKNRTPPRLEIEVHANTPPKVGLTAPGKDARVSPLEELRLEAQATDDVGLAAWGITYSLTGSKDRELAIGGPGSEQQTYQKTLALEELKAKPGDVLVLYAWADDVDGSGKRRRQRGDFTILQVRPFEEKFREAASQGSSDPQSGQQQEEGELADRQKEIVNATWRLLRQAWDGATDQQQDIEVVHEGQGEVRDQALQELARARSAVARDALTRATEAMQRTEAHLTSVKPEKDRLTAALDDARAALAALMSMPEAERQVTRGQREQRGRGRQRTGLAELEDLELKQEEHRYETRREAQAEQPDSAGSEDRQVLSRLRELARRQQGLTERMKQLELALKEAKRPEDRQQAEAQLERLRQEQRDLLAQLDEVGQQMDRPENRSRMAEARSELERTRGQLEQAAEALGRREAAAAAGASTRAERQLNETRDRFQRKVAEQFAEEMRELRTKAAALDETQRSLGQAMERGRERAAAVARNGRVDAGAAETERRELAEALDRQRKSTAELMERMRAVTDAAEPTSPLLSRRLYDTLRKAKTADVERALEVASALVERNAFEHAAPAERAAASGIGGLRQGVDEAARAVLGDEAQGIRMARGEVERLMQEVGQEAGGSGPISGENFRGFSDRLRDVEELMPDQRLRTEAARIRDQARALRGDSRRHSERPSFALLQEKLMRPLSDLRDRLSEELSRLEPGDKATPIDRDPVPAPYSELVRRYYRSLGEGK